MIIDCALGQGLTGNTEIDAEIIKERVIHLIMWHGVLSSCEYKQKAYQSRINYIVWRLER